MANSVYHFDFTGRVVEIGATQTFGSGFKKRTIVIDNTEEGDDYHNPTPFILMKDKCSEADKLKVGDSVQVKGWFNGRKWHNPNKNIDQYFCDNSIGVMNVVRGATDTPKYQVPEPAEPPADESEIADDLPF